MRPKTGPGDAWQVPNQNDAVRQIHNNVRPMLRVLLLRTLAFANVAALFYQYQAIKTVIFLNNIA